MRVSFSLAVSGRDSLALGLDSVLQDKGTRLVCPEISGGSNLWPAAYSPRTKLFYIPSLEGCAEVTPDHGAHVPGKFAGGTYTHRTGSPAAW